MAYVVVIRANDCMVSPVVIGPFDSREQAMRYGAHYDYRLRSDQMWSVTQIATIGSVIPNDDTFLDLI